jgi:hypothetical protein
MATGSTDMVGSGPVGRVEPVEVAGPAGPAEPVEPVEAAGMVEPVEVVAGPAEPVDGASSAVGAGSAGEPATVRFATPRLGPLSGGVGRASVVTLCMVLPVPAPLERKRRRF